MGNTGALGGAIVVTTLLLLTSVLEKQLLHDLVAKYGYEKIVGGLVILFLIGLLLSKSENKKEIDES